MLENTIRDRFYLVIDGMEYKERREACNDVIKRRATMSEIEAIDTVLQVMEKRANMTYEEIGRELNISPAMAKQDCYRALSKLKQRLESRGIKCTDDFLN